MPTVDGDTVACKATVLSLDCNAGDGIVDPHSPDVRDADGGNCCLSSSGKTLG
jgi:hypothetical protein